MGVYIGNDSNPLGNPMLLPSYLVPDVSANKIDSSLNAFSMGHNGTAYNLTWDKFSDTQISILSLSSRVASIMSIGCSFIVLLTFVLWQRYRTPANRLLTFMAIADLASACAAFVGPWTTAVDDYSPLCIFQGMVMQWGDLSSIAWTAAMSFNLFMVLFMTRSARDLASLEKYYFFLCYGVSFIVAFIPVFISTPEAGDVYGKDRFWCWISDKWDVLRLPLFYAPICLVFLFNLTIYIVSSVRILIRTSNLPAVSSKNLRSSVVSLAASPRPKSTSQISMESDMTSRLIANSTVSTTSTTAANSTANITPMNLDSFRSRYFVRVALFQLAYILAWLLPSVNRTRKLLMGTHDDFQGEYFMWYWAQEILTPLRGSINFLCYYLLAVSNVLEERRYGTRK